MDLSSSVYAIVLVAMVAAVTPVESSESTDSVLPPCPNTPNCVSSRAVEKSQKMEPLGYTGSEEDARERLLKVIRSFPRSTVVRDSGKLLKVEFRSAIFSFVDDVTFEFDHSSKTIHFRSASRSGYYDFGVNRRRMNEVLRRFASEENSTAKKSHSGRR